MNRLERTDDFVASVQTAIEGALSELWVAMPAIIHHFDASSITCTAQPAIKGLVTKSDGTQEWVQMPLLVDVPVTFPSGGGYTLTFPVKQGDECLIVFASRCIDNWWLSGGIQTQAELRIQDLSDGFAIVGPRSQSRLIGVDTEAVQLKADDGNSFIEIRGQDITAQAAGDFKAINGAGAMTSLQGGQIVMSAPDSISLSAPNGAKMNCGGKVEINASGGVWLNGHRLDEHTHPDVQPGSGNTGVNQ